MTNEEKVRAALAGALTNAMNYPDDVAHTVLGTDMSGIIDKAVEAVLMSGAVETMDDLFGRPQVDRVEVIDDRGRAYTNYSARDVVTSLQDGGKTLKVFLNG